MASVQLTATASGIRSHLVQDARNGVHHYYGLPTAGTQPEKARAVAYLLEKDRFMCEPSGYTVRYFIRAVVSRSGLTVYRRASSGSCRQQ